MAAVTAKEQVDRKFMMQPMMPVSEMVNISMRATTEEEMSTAIDRFKRWAAQNGIYMPEPGDEQLLALIRYEMDKQRNYL